jgi:hypothetical protein
MYVLSVYVGLFDGKMVDWSYICYSTSKVMQKEKKERKKEEKYVKRN